MIVKRAEVLGRCMGVRRAVDLAMATADSDPSRPVYTLGPLIHNPQAVAELEARGVIALASSDIDERVRGKSVVIRAHGVPPLLRSRLEELGARVVDATCPRVIASQRKARDYAAKGWKVIIAGDRDHGEVAGIAGYASAGWAVVGSSAEAEALELEGKAVVIAQTTIKTEEYKAICEVIARRFQAVELVDSICPATEDRQRALGRLAAETDALVVVGGRNSANTSRLFTTALALGKPAWHVETAAELPEEVFAYTRVGVTAGASTPESLVAEVEAALVSRGAAAT
ncbi:MAG TPA: 4-hydroxy-3-methylbut-2-enyl diphosphate reductase [Rectinemataceae bacterium]|nr:4-hydroxy-3-methylbut-2-enyl diphosphate reductase [Rectinemataceae bacterium]